MNRKKLREGVEGMADSNDIMLMAHLMRRAGFGASYEELEQRAAKGYEATVEELLHPEEQPDLQMDVMNRYMHGWRDMNGVLANQGYWTYRMVNSPGSWKKRYACSGTESSAWATPSACAPARFCWS